MSLLSIFRGSKKAAKKPTDESPYLISPESEAVIENTAEEMAAQMPDNFSTEDMKLTTAYLISRMAFLEETLRITIEELKAVQQDAASKK